MKTIFITIFEGVESKNILRTSVLTTLLETPDVELVLFTKSAERVAYHEKEFHNPRIRYVVVEPQRPTGLDWFFSRLKFFLLNTETMRLRRRMVLDARKNYISYYGGAGARFIFARPIFRRIARAFDFLLVRNHLYTSYFKKYHPDLVLCANLFDEPEMHLLREAKRRGVRSVGLINSWDKVTARCIMRILPDKAIVFNHIVKEELMRYNEMSEADIFVSGLPQYDRYFSEKVTPREEFFKKIGLPPETKLIVYSPVGAAVSNSDWDIIDLLYDYNRQGKFGDGVAVMVRFPPNDFFSAEELTKRPDLLYEYPGIRFSKKRGIDWDMTFEELRHLGDTLAHMSLLVGYTTSISIDAAVFDKPVINIRFEVHPQEIMAKSPTYFYEMTHYKKVFRTGGVREVQSPAELVLWVRKYLADPSMDREGRKRLVGEQCVYTDGRAGERIAQFLLKIV